MLGGSQMLTRFSFRFSSRLSQWENWFTFLNVKTGLKSNLRFSHEWELRFCYSSLVAITLLFIATSGNLCLQGTAWNSITLTLWNWGGALGLNHCFQWQLVKTVIIWTLSSLGLSVNATVTENSALPCPCLSDRQTAPALPWPPFSVPCPAPASCP